VRTGDFLRFVKETFSDSQGWYLKFVVTLMVSGLKIKVMENLPDMSKPMIVHELLSNQGCWRVDQCSRWLSAFFAQAVVTTAASFHLDCQRGRYWRIARLGRKGAA
jgi:hypothetical protein